MIKIFVKTFKILVGSTIISSIPLVHADTLGLEIGAYQWNADYSGTAAVDSNSLLGTTLDMNDDLGFTDESHSVLWVKFEHPIPFLPNLKLVSSNIDTSAVSLLTRDIVFGGDAFTANENLYTQMDLSNTEYTLYYELLDNWLNLDVGLTLRQYDGIVTLASDSTGPNNNDEVLDFVIPLLYINGRFDLPLTGFFVEGSMNVIRYDNDSLSDTELAIGYENEYGLGVKLAHRSLSMEVDEANFQSNLDLSGVYFSLYYHF